jgi:hypothetical protein
MAISKINSKSIEDLAISAADLEDGTLTLAKLSATGTKDATTFLRGDNSFVTVTTDLVNDTTPQLGGTLDINSQEITGSLIPDTTDTYDLGSSSKVWANIYTGDLNLSNEGKSEGNSFDGTKGNWTIQEGAEDLFIVNNKSGKKYKFKLEEI